MKSSGLFFNQYINSKSTSIQQVLSNGFSTDRELLGSPTVSFGRELSARGLFRGLPREPLDAAAVEAGLETVVRKLERRGVIG